tara:strand:- start:681 stop:902 length:222 start_codon:yes stop_codon:yes gene_type:complete
VKKESDNQVSLETAYKNAADLLQKGEFYKTERAVKTASSEQVRQPINTKGLNQWKNFESHLNDLKHYLAPIEN